MTKKQSRMSKILDLVHESFQDRNIPIKYTAYRYGNGSAKIVLSDVGVTFNIEVKNVYVHLRTNGYVLKGFTEKHIVEGIEDVLSRFDNVPSRNRVTYEKDTQQLLGDMDDKEYIKDILSRHFLVRARELRNQIKHKNENSKPIEILIKQLDDRMVDFGE